MTAESCVLDVGGGDSHLVDVLTARGMDCLAVLDVSGTALERARARLGGQARLPIWIEADVTSAWTLKPMDIWHDRAVFHFLTTPDDRARYKHHLNQTSRWAGQPSSRRSRQTARNGAVACRCSSTLPCS